MKKSTFDYVDDLTSRYPTLVPCRAGVIAAAEAIIACYKNGKKIMTCGNGGSAADALHIVGELMKSFALPRPVNDEIRSKLNERCEDSGYIIANLQEALPALSLVNETALITAFSNDQAPDMAFAQQVYGYGNEGDVLISISTSGNSKNVLYASEVAAAKGLTVVALTGATGGRLKSVADILINVPETETYKVQELHLPVYHAICLAVENAFFGR